MTKISSIIVIASCAVFVLILANCSDASRYSGDGHLVDNGIVSATDRYVLDLGAISLSKKAVYTFNLTNLPRENFVVGIEIRVSPEYHSKIENKSIKPTISIDLSGPNGAKIIHDKSSLDAWTWSVKGDENNAFVYRRDQPSTFFTPVANEKYILRIKIVQPDSSNINYSARLLAKSGGWK
jgi:hypothetical protein